MLPAKAMEYTKTRFIPCLLRNGFLECCAALASQSMFHEFTNERGTMSCGEMAWNHGAALRGGCFFVLRCVGVGGDPFPYSNISHDFLLRQHVFPETALFEYLLTPTLTQRQVLPVQKKITRATRSL